MEKISESLPKVVKPGSSVKLSGASLDDFSILCNNLQYSVFYFGSITTPPCTETVTWMVCVQPISTTLQDVSYDSVLKTWLPLESLKNSAHVQNFWSL